MTQQELWDHMDDPSNVFKFVRFHELEAEKHSKSGSSGHYSLNETTGLIDPGDDRDLDDEYIEDLNCALYDDDNQYPNDQCIRGDNLTCHTAVYSNFYYDQTCHDACTDERGGWGVPCGWQGMKNLKDVCKKKDKKGWKGAKIPTDSKNIDPSEVRQQNYFVSTTGKWFWT